MADLASTYYFGTSSSVPKIQYKLTYTSTRTDVNTVKTNVKLTLLKMASSSAYFGYSIYAQLTVGSKTGSKVTVKGNSPSTWDEFTVDLGTITNTGVAATTTSLAASVNLTSNSDESRQSNTGSRTVSFPAGNTNAYWTSGKFCTVTPSGFIPENTDTLKVSWGGAKDDQNDTIYYTTEFWANGTNVGYVDQSATTATSGSVSISSYGEGSSFYFRTHCRDGHNTGNGVFGVQSSTVTKNTLTPAQITSCTSISFSSESITVIRDNASNTNGNTIFTYTLSCPQITIYNTNVTNAGTDISVKICRAGETSTGPYILFSDLQEYFKGNSYTGSLTFILSTTNNYGTTKTDTQSIVVDIRTQPSAPKNINFSGGYIIEGNVYYVINRRGITVNWDSCTDPHGGWVTYDIQRSIDNGSWLSCQSNITATSYSTSTLSRNSAGIIKFRIRSKTSYGTYSEWVESSLLPIHYYNPLHISDLSIDRETNSQTTTGKITPNTSIPNLSYNASIIYKNETSTIATQSVIITKEYPFSYTQTGIAESLSFKETITVSDNISDEIFAITAPQSSGIVIVPRYSALLTIREKGIGINSVAGNFADFIVKGATSIYGGDKEKSTSNAISISTNRSESVDWYIGLYIDSDGNIRTAQSLAKYDTIFHIQSVTSYPPLRWRYIYPLVEKTKDEVVDITNSSEFYVSSWYSFTDAIGSGASFSSWASSLSSYLQSYFLRNNFTNGIWRKRDCGYFSSSGGTGQLLIPVGTNQTATDYGELELSLMWYSSGYTQKIWVSWYTSGSSSCVNGTYLSSIPSTNAKLVWNSTNTQKMICIGDVDTSWSSLRMVNVDQYISRNGSYKPTSMNPTISTTVYTTLGTAGYLNRA